MLVALRVKKTDRKPRLPVKLVRTGSGLGRFQTDPNLKFEFEFKKMKIPKKILKILQVATNLMVSKNFKYSFIWYTLRAFEFKQKKRAYKSIQIQCKICYTLY